MTRNQYLEIAKDFSKYADLKVEYKALIRSLNISKVRYKTYKGILRGVGVGCNNECFIVQQNIGGVVAIHYRYIKFPEI